MSSPSPLQLLSRLGKGQKAPPNLSSTEDTQATGSAPTRLPRLTSSKSLSGYSSDLIRNAIFYSGDFRLAAGLVIIQPSSGNVVVVHDTKKDVWFIPRGRKDVGESVEDAALREGYEESGYKAEFLPLLQPTLAPNPRAEDDGLRSGEPLFMRFIGSPSLVDPDTKIVYRRGDEYVCHYYVGQIPADAVREENTMMSDERSYIGKLLSLEEAKRKMTDQTEAFIIGVAYDLWRETVEYCQQISIENESPRSKGELRLREE